MIEKAAKRRVTKDKGGRNLRYTHLNDYIDRLLIFVSSFLSFSFRNGVLDVERRDTVLQNALNHSRTSLLM